MAISAAVTAGPNITSTADIKFSTFKRNFVEMNPRTTYGGSETFDADSGEIRASQLLRTTAIADDGVVTQESDIDYAIPFVPNCTENANVVTTQSNWKTSHFVGTIKYYYLQQTTTDDLNLNISSQSWNSNLDQNLRKWFFIDGTIGSNDANPAATLSGDVNNLSIKISASGEIFGRAGAGGNGGPGGDGGDAVSWTATGNTNNYIILLTDSKLYAGGGGGGQGGSGGPGGTGGAGGVRRIQCFPGPNFGCVQDTSGGGAGGGTRPGGVGGTGAGYANQTPDLAGGPGGQTNGGQGYSGPGGNGGSGGPSGANTAGGTGGDFGAAGVSRTGSVGGSGSPGSGGFISSTSTVCGGGPGPQRFFTCQGGPTGGSGGGGGGAGTAGGAAGASIRRSGAPIPYTLIGNDSDTFKGTEST